MKSEFLFSYITEKRDPYTAGHQERVSIIASLIAEEMNLSLDEIKRIKIAGMLHDIGKIYVPSEILSKPSKLDNCEMEVVKRHCKIGFDILRKISFPWNVGEIVYQHHERLDGSGYPEGVLDKKISLESKINGLLLSFAT